MKIKLDISRIEIEYLKTLVSLVEKNKGNFPSLRETTAVINRTFNATQRVITNLLEKEYLAKTETNYYFITSKAFDLLFMIDFAKQFEQEIDFEDDENEKESE